MCGKGHPNDADAAFGGTCGERLDSDAGGETANAACPEGHLNPAANRFCGTCGTSLAREPTPATAGRVELRKGRIAAFVALSLVVTGAVALVAALGGSDGDDDRRAGRATATTEEVTVTTDPVLECAVELGEWLPYVTGRSGGSLQGAAAEFGVHSPEYRLIQEAWGVFN